MRAEIIVLLKWKSRVCCLQYSPPQLPNRVGKRYVRLHTCICTDYSKLLYVQHLSRTHSSHTGTGLGLKLWLELFPSLSKRQRFLLKSFSDWNNFSDKGCVYLRSRNTVFFHLFVLGVDSLREQAELNKELVNTVFSNLNFFY